MVYVGDLASHVDAVLAELRTGQPWLPGDAEAALNALTAGEGLHDAEQRWYHR